MAKTQSGVKSRCLIWGARKVHWSRISESGLETCDNEGALQLVCQLVRESSVFTIICL